MPSRRVLHINDYAADSLGGAEVLMGRTVQLLRSAGWDVRTFTNSDLPDKRMTAKRYVSNGVATSALRRLLDEFRPHIVHLHNYYHHLSPGILSVLRRDKRRRGTRVLMTAHDFHLVCPNSGGNWFQGRLHLVDPDRMSSWRYLLTHRWDHRGRMYSWLKLAQFTWHYRLGRDARRVIDLVLCPSRFMQSMVDRIGLPTVHAPLPNPEPTGDRPPRSATLTYVFAGRVEPEKGIVDFLRLMPVHFAGRLLIVGDGSDRSSAEAVVKERGLSDRVDFLGRRPHADTLTIIASANVAVLPSLYFENYPLSLIEALSAGTNLLVSDVGGMKEIVADSGVGRCFTPGDADGIAAAMDHIAAAHSTGTLNAFDASAFLDARTPAAYVSSLERAYVGGVP